MNKRTFLMLMALIPGSFITGTVAFAEEAEEFPLRKTYPDVRVIETADLTSRMAEFTIVDVRSPFEYEIMHIKDAVNLPIANKDFMEKIKATGQEGGKPLAFYCNGHRCEKAYQAASRAQVMGKLDRVNAYDGGINDWAKANPQLTLLLGKPLDPKALISDEQFKAHLLAPKDFVGKIRAASNAPVIDLRDSFQTEGVSLFPARETRTGFDMAKLKKAISEAKAANQPIFFYDATGLQVKPLQYLLEDMGMKEYYFMKGGMAGYFDMLKAK